MQGFWSLDARMRLLQGQGRFLVRLCRVLAAQGSSIIRILQANWASFLTGNARKDD